MAVDLEAITQRYEEASHHAFMSIPLDRLVLTDVPNMMAEIESLRAELSRASEDKSEFEMRVNELEHQQHITNTELSSVTQKNVMATATICRLEADLAEFRASLKAKFVTISEVFTPAEAPTATALYLVAPVTDCICGEINARNCPVHNDPPHGDFRP